MAGRGKYEPKDSRNVTGTATTPDGRWTKPDRLPPLANGDHEAPQPYEEEDEDGDAMSISFTPDPDLAREIEDGRRRRNLDRGENQTRH